MIDKRAIRDRYDCRTYFRDTWPQHFREKGNSLSPFRDDNNPSMQLSVDHVYDHGDKKSYDIISLHQQATGLDFKGALADLAQRAGIQESGNGTGKRGGKKRIVATYPYVDREGHLLFEVVRFEPKGFAQRRPDGKGRWVWNLDGVERVVYRLPEVLKAGQAFVVEGEKDADNLAALGLCATTSPQGAGKWTVEMCGPFSGIEEAVILPDNDPPGRDHAAAVARMLLESKGVVGDNVKILELPGLPPKGDVSDWLNAGGSREELLRLVDQCPKWTPPPKGTTPQQPEGAAGTGGNEAERKKETQAQKLIELAADAELFRDDGDGRFATIPQNDHRETWPIRSRGFKDWLLRRFYLETGKAPGTQAMQDALGILEARARFDGPERSVFVRIGEHGGNIYVDLCDPGWPVVEITPAGWTVVESPLKFRRTPGMLPLPIPERGGSLLELRPFINSDEDAFKLIVAWLVQAHSCTGPYPILVVEGEQGTGKSCVARMLRSLVDPATAPLRTLPREERDLAIAAANSWLLAYDNLSGLSKDISDALCKVATGSGFATRQLYTDDAEAIFNSCRPILLNGIDRIASRGDLLSRSIVVSLSPIPDHQRKTETELWRAFDAVRPRVLGALFDAVSTALRRLPETKLDRLPRMADFALWVSAAEPALPWELGGFMAAYTGNRIEAVAASIEGDPVASTIRDFMQTRETWRGTAKELLDSLGSMVDEATKRTKGWPQDPRGIGRKVRRMAPLLRAISIELSEGKDEDGFRGRFMKLDKIGNKTSHMSQTSQTPANPHESYVSAATCSDSDMTQHVANLKNVAEHDASNRPESQPKDMCDVCDVFLHTLSKSKSDSDEETQSEEDF